MVLCELGHRVTEVTTPTCRHLLPGPWKESWSAWHNLIACPVSSPQLLSSLEELDSTLASFRDKAETGSAEMSNVSYGSVLYLKMT